MVVQPGVESWLGLYASVRRMENFDPVINFGREFPYFVVRYFTKGDYIFAVVNKLFIQMNLDLITFYLAIENDVRSNIPYIYS